MCVCVCVCVCDSEILMLFRLILLTYYTIRIYFTSMPGIVRPKSFVNRQIHLE